MLKNHRHHFVRVIKKPWLSSFGTEVTLECSICHKFTHVSEKDIEKIEAKTRLPY